MNDARAQTIRYDGNETKTEGEDHELHSLQAYVSDLLALERHLERPIETQRTADALARYPAAKTLIDQIAAQNRAHIEALEATLKLLGGHGAAPLKSAWASLLGGAAAAIGASRKTKVTKWLRDDDTALNLAAFSYGLLHATALGLDDEGVARLGRAGMADYARSVMEINQLVPEIVLDELAEEGNVVATGAAERVREETNEIWRRQAGAVRT
jgi:hypothetical protein